MQTPVLPSSCLVYDPLARWPEAALVRAHDAFAAPRLRLEDRAQLTLRHPPSSPGRPSSGALSAEIVAGLVAAGERLLARNNVEVQAIWLLSGLDSVPTAGRVVLRRVALALGAEEQRRWRAAPVAAASAEHAAAPDAIHISFGCEVGLIRCEGRLVRDALGDAVDPRALWSTSDAQTLRDMAAKPASSQQASALEAGRHAAVQAALGRWIGQLIALFDVADVWLHLPDAAAQTWLGFPAGWDGEGGLEGDGAACGALGRAVAASAFASLRAGTRLRTCFLDADAASVGAARAVVLGLSRLG